MELNNDEMSRYARHLSLEEIGLEGQQKIRAARVLCVGVGGLGSPACLYLAAAGVGRLGLADFDPVDLSNLQRQVIHGTRDLGRPKIESARDRILDLNPQVEVVLHPERLTAANALRILEPYDLIIDATDNFPARYLINDACVLLKKPNFYGSILRFEGQASVFAPHQGGPCYRCLYPEPPPPGHAPSCAEAGVLGVVPGLIGVIQATEALKWILGRGQSLLGRLLFFNALDMKCRELKVRPDPLCAVCGSKPTITQLADLAPSCQIGRSTPAGSPPTSSPSQNEVTIHDMKQALENPGLGIHVLDIREADEYQQCHIEGVPLLPLSALPQRWTELDPQKSYYLHCRSGVRSLKAVRFLQDRGFASVKSVQGGICAWRETIDPHLPKI